RNQNRSFRNILSSFLVPFPLSLLPFPSSGIPENHVFSEAGRSWGVGLTFGCVPQGVHSPVLISSSFGWTDLERHLLIDSRLEAVHSADGCLFVEQRSCVMRVRILAPAALWVLAATAGTVLSQQSGAPEMFTANAQATA